MVPIRLYVSPDCGCLRLALRIETSRSTEAELWRSAVHQIWVPGHCSSRRRIIVRFEIKRRGNCRSSTLNTWSPSRDLSRRPALTRSPIILRRKQGHSVLPTYQLSDFLRTVRFTAGHFAMSRIGKDRKANYGWLSQPLTAWQTSKRFGPAWHATAVLVR